MNKLLQPLQAYPLAALDFAKAVGQIGKWLQLSDQPLPTTVVPTDYFGINVAPADDANVDDYIVARLNEIGLGQVRMDFSYDSFEGPAERLLDRLIVEGFRVMLEVFPPLDQAKQLFKDHGAQQNWADFLSRVFSRYEGKVEWFEIGSTPNRGRWSGFSFLSYQAAWGIAVEQASDSDIILAGPNVSDFEPFYNASFLSYMKRFGRSPDIHSDNLFVERVVEPEAYDHRVFGRFATHYLKLNLLKKARILHRIGQDNGSPELVCTYKCWTAKRLARRSPWPEQKRVDYLVRYLALAASSNAMRRVYWGPLICSRDGLISDQIEDYPVIDQVSYYQRVRGELENFDITPGFYALAHAVSRFSGARCTCIQHQPYGLSLFRFEPNEGQAFTLAWCRDGMSWPLTGVFADDQLDQAEFFNAVGEKIPRPAVINEQALFIEFKEAEVTPNLSYAQLHATPGVIHLVSPSQQSVGDSVGTWTGASMLRADHQHQDLATIASLRPSELLSLEETAVLRDARNRIWNVKDPRNICDQVSIKLNRVVGMKRISYRFKPSKGQRHWNNACEMLRRGIKTPLPIAFYEQNEKPGIRDSWYLCEFIPGAFSAREVYRAFRDGADEYRGMDKQAWFRCLAEFTCEMHNKQIVHRDLSAGNLLLRQRDDGTIDPHLIDIGRAWLGNGSGLKQRHRLLDLMRICYKLNWSDRESFVAFYELYMGRSFSRLWKIPFHYYDNKQKFKKKLKGGGKKRSDR
ncbi:MAG: lipopolysaccharide kinase InaA family protein [Halioglobus sp.]